MDKQGITRPGHITSAGKINHQCLNILGLMFTVILLKKTDVRMDVPEQFLLFISRKIGAQWQMIFIENDLR